MARSEFEQLLGILVPRFERTGDVCVSVDNEMKAADTRRLEHVWKPAYHDLEACAVCDSFEGATTTECPGRRMTQTEIDMVYAGGLDYRRIGFSSGTFRFGWVEAPSGSCSSHSSMPGLPRYDEIEVRAAAEKHKAAAFEYAFKNSRAQLGLPRSIMANHMIESDARSTNCASNEPATAAYSPTPQGPDLWKDAPSQREPKAAIAYEDPELGKSRTCYLCGRVHRKFRALNPPICTNCRT